jgi:hypothetical protein
MVGAQFLRQRFLVFPPRNADRSKAHFGGILNPKMPQAAQPEHGDDLARPRSAIPKAIKGRDTGAHQRRRLYGR